MATSAYFGKIVGALLALIWAPPEPLPLLIYLAVGVAFGHGWDLLNHYLVEIWAKRRRQPPERPYLTFTFAALGRIAKASGRVSEAHIAQAENIMKTVGMREADRDSAIAWFNEGKSDEVDFAALATTCLSSTEDRLSSTEDQALMRRMCVECMSLMAWAEGRPDDAARAELAELAGLLNADAEELAAAEKAVMDYQHRQLPEPLRDAHDMLGVEYGAADDELKLAYRRLMSRYHPDKHGGETSNERSVQIQNAFDAIVESRKPTV